MKKWIAVMLVALMALSLIACGSKGSESGAGDGIVGTWELDHGIGDEGKQAVDMIKAFGITMSITFKADGTGSIDSEGMGQSDSQSFNYTYENGKLTIEGADGSNNIKISGNELTLEQDGVGMVFKKK